MATPLRVLPLLAAAGVAVALISPASATPMVPASADLDASTSISVGAERSDVTWSKERMLAAQPLHGGQSDAERIAAGKRAIKSPTSVGRLFFKNGRTDMFCTASSVASRYRNVGVTAAECVHRGKGNNKVGWYTDFTFVPGYNDGEAPFGTFKVDFLRAKNGWVYHQKRQYNVALFNTFPLHGKYLNNVVGGNGILIGDKPVQRDMRVWGFGYEGGSGVMHYCQENTTASNTFQGAGEMECEDSHGFQGAPWFVADRRKKNTGFLYGVTSEVALVSDREIITAYPFGDWLTEDLRQMPRT